MMYKGRTIAKASPDELMEQTKTDNLLETFRPIIDSGAKSAESEGEDA